MGDILERKWLPLGGGDVDRRSKSWLDDVRGSGACRLGLIGLIVETGIGPSFGGVSRPPDSSEGRAECSTLHAVGGGIRPIMLCEADADGACMAVDGGSASWDLSAPATPATGCGSDIDGPFESVGGSTVGCVHS